MKFRDLSMRLKLMISFSALILIPLLIITSLSMYFITEKIEDGMTRRIDEALTVALNSFDNLKEETKQEAVNISQNAVIQKAIKEHDKVKLIEFTDIKRNQMEKLTLEIADGQGYLLARSFETDENRDLFSYQDADPTRYLTGFRLHHKPNTTIEDDILSKGIAFSAFNSIKRVNDGRDILIRGVSSVQTYGDPFGIVVAGYLLNDAVAAKIAEITSTDVTLFVGDQPIASTFPDSVRQHVVPAEESEFNHLFNEQNSFGLIKDLGHGQYAMRYAPIRDDNKSIVGLIAVSISRGDLEAIKKTALKNIGILSGIAFLFALLMGHLIAKQVTNPINRLARGAKAVASGDLDVQIDVDSEDEIGIFARTFNEMTRAVKSARLQMEKNTFDTIATLSKALEARDPYTEGHSLRVAEYSVALAKLIGVDDNDLKLIYNSGLLHDVGKIGIRDSVLLKDSRLTDDEFEIIKTHPKVGDDIVSNLEFLLETIPMIRHHHEKYDGKGYPDGLQGEDIPLFARIMAIADTFDAMTTERPYKPGRPMDFVINEFERCAGTQFDPALVKVFVQGLKDGSITDNRHSHKRAVRLVRSIVEEVHPAEMINNTEKPVVKSPGPDSKIITHEKELVA